MDQPYSSTGTAAFNSGLFIIETIAKLERKAHEYLILGDLVTAYDILEQVEVELVGYKKKETELKDLEVKKKAIDNVLKNWGGLDKKGNSTWTAKGPVGKSQDFNKAREAKKLVLDYFKSLKSYKQGSGLGMKEDTDPEFAIDES